jgi:hypothetical protein
MRMVTMSKGWNLRLTCDRCSSKIMDDEPAIVFQRPDGDLGLCEKCVEEVKGEFIDENRDTNIIESGD